MKKIFIFSIILLVSCTDGNKRVEHAADSLALNDTASRENAILPDTKMPEKYSNERFREVTVEKIKENKFRIRGKAQIFEASFNWIVKEGHHELKSGYATTSAGAPEWGKFVLDLDVLKINKDSALTLILFEISAKDGSSQYELAIPLP